MSSVRCAFAAAGILFGVAVVQAATTTVNVVDFDFTPDPVINTGDTVHWVWIGDFPHSTTSVAGLSESWNSGVQSTGATYDHLFTQTGSFDYYCVLHGADLGNGTAGGMAGTITVVPEPASLALLVVGGLAT